MSILLLVRNFVPAHEMIERGDWQVSEIARNAYDLEGKVIGTLGAGRIGYRVLERLQPFNPKELLYYDYNPLPEESRLSSVAICCKRTNFSRISPNTVCEDSTAYLAVLEADNEFLPGPYKNIQRKAKE
ncbi:hypothetical protein NUW54_g12885 [Trametes sanguinea]|uniref:Uncharacterized protein n=1 Tax=Trametes sanguinea TaxID=158606 RepID=A0ACC1MSS3_9APHY|nr:hypothetical protein NUW54_g12885 [Trametes sanguinea]